MNQPQDKDRIWDLLLKIMVPISIAYFSWSVVTVFEIDKRVSVIENNRYTPAHALDFERSTQRKFDRISEIARENSSQLAFIKELLIRIEVKLKEDGR